MQSHKQNHVPFIFRTETLLRRRTPCPFLAVLFRCRLLILSASGCLHVQTRGWRCPVKWRQHGKLPQALCSAQQTCFFSEQYFARRLQWMLYDLLGRWLLYRIMMEQMFRCVFSLITRIAMDGEALEKVLEDLLDACAKLPLIDLLTVLPRLLSTDCNIGICQSQRLLAQMRSDAMKPDPLTETWPPTNIKTGQERIL